MKKQMEYADRRGIPFVVIVGENELAARQATVKEMRSGEQATVAFTEVADYLRPWPLSRVPTDTPHHARGGRVRRLVRPY